LARLEAVVTGFAGTTGTLSVAVAGYDASGVLGTGAWTVSVTGNGTFALAADLIKVVTDVTGITYPASITDGAITVNGLGPSGRVNPPT
jgi:hypothetical protein